METLNDLFRVVRSASENDAEITDFLAANHTGHARLSSVFYKVGQNSLGNFICLQAEGKGDASETFTLTVYGGNRGSGFLEKVSVVTGSLLDLAGNVYQEDGSPITYKPAAFTAATNLHPLEVYTSGSDEIGRLYFDACGFEYLVLHISDLGGGSGADSVKVMMRAY